MGNPERNEHEGKPGRGSRQYPEVRVGNAERDPWPRVDTREPVRLTGQWRNADERYHVFINQAGPHIELLIALVENSQPHTEDMPIDKRRSKERIIRLGGDIDPIDRSTYHLYAHIEGQPIDDKHLACGRLRHHDFGKWFAMQFDLSGFEDKGKVLPKLEKMKNHKCARLGSDPNLFETHLGRSWIPAEVRTATWFPLTPSQVAKLQSLFFKVRVALMPVSYLIPSKDESTQTFSYIDLVERYYALRAKEKAEKENGEDASSPSSTQRRQRMSNIVTGLDKLVADARSEAMQTPPQLGGIDGYQEDYWRIATLDAFRAKSLMLDAGYPKSLLIHTEGVLDSAPGGASVENFKKLLHLQRSTGGNNYKAELEMTDLDDLAGEGKKLAIKWLKKLKKGFGKHLRRRFPVNVSAGLLTVTKDGKDGYVAEYLVVLMGFKVSETIGKAAPLTLVRSSGEALNVPGQIWRPEHLEGRVIFMELGVSGFIGRAGKGASGTVLVCFGSGKTKPPVPLQINFSGLSDIFGAGGSLSGSAVLYGGELFLIDSKGQVKIDVPDKPFTFDYGVHSNAAPLHFPINGAGLTGEACELLEIFAACELAVLSRPGVTLTLHGFADQPDQPLHNEILSRNRAMSVYNYLKNILESDLAAPELKEIIDEEKELARAKATPKGKAYVLADPSNDQVVVIAGGAEAAKEHAPAKPGYDAAFRRVDVRVDGDLSLMMRRRRDIK